MRKDLNYYKQELREKEAQIEVLRQIGETISQTQDLQEVLSSIVEIVSAYFEADSCFIYLIENNSLVLRASQNPHKNLIGKISLKIGEGITGWVAKNKKSVVINEKAFQDERFKDFPNLPEDKYEAFLSLPIIFKNKIIGVINVQHLKKREYNKDRVTFVKMIARQIGGAIDNARLMSETSLLKDALETKKIVDRAKAILIKRYNLSEDAAHRLLSKKSMDKRKTVKEIAEAIILTEEILVNG